MSRDAALCAVVGDELAASRNRHVRVALQGRAEVDRVAVRVEHKLLFHLVARVAPCLERRGLIGVRLPVRRADERAAAEPDLRQTRIHARRLEVAAQFHRAAAHAEYLVANARIRIRRGNTLQWPRVAVADRTGEDARKFRRASLHEEFRIAPIAANVGLLRRRGIQLAAVEDKAEEIVRLAVPLSENDLCVGLHLDIRARAKRQRCVGGAGGRMAEANGLQALGPETFAQNRLANSGRIAKRREPKSHDNVYVRTGNRRIRDCRHGDCGVIARLVLETRHEGAVARNRVTRVDFVRRRRKAEHAAVHGNVL